MTGTMMAGLDGPQGSYRALAWAIRQAGHAARPCSGDRMTAELRLRPRTVTAGRREDHPDRAAAAAGSRRGGRRPAPGRHHRPGRPRRRPGQVLCARSAGAGLLVVGRRGHGSGLAGLVPGSVSATCARHSHCPVVILSAGGQDPGPAAVAPPAAEQQHR